MISAAVMCLALNLYFEARSESIAGQLMVGFSTMNRVADTRYPNTVCGALCTYVTNIDTIVVNATDVDCALGSVHDETAQR